MPSFTAVLTAPSLHRQYGFTPVHLAARAGHNGVLSQLRSQHASMRITSRKNGLSALHVAAFYGEAGKSGGKRPLRAANDPPVLKGG